MSDYNLGLMVAAFNALSELEGKPSRRVAFVIEQLSDAIMEEKGQSELACPSLGSEWRNQDNEPCIVITIANEHDVNVPTLVVYENNIDCRRYAHELTEWYLDFNELNGENDG